MPIFKKKNKTSSSLRIIPLGGNGDVQKNLYVYEYGNDIVLFDCGIGFPKADILGVDVVIPDFTYLHTNAKKIRGLVVTHAHEDHMGAIPYLLQRLKMPIYASRLCLGFISNKLDEFHLLKGTPLFEIDPDKGFFSLGVFKITPFRVNHSVPEAMGFCIETPVGKVFHVPDFKFDWTPVDGHVFDVDRATMLARGGVRLLLSDCLGATSEGYTKSERVIEKTFNEIFDTAKGQVFITTLSSNISRIKQAVDASIHHNRKVVPVGLSVVKNIETAVRLGYLNVPKEALVDADKARRMRPQDITYVISGSYGQLNSALSKVAENENKFATLKKGDVVVFSADPIPGVHDSVDALIDKLTLLGANVIYSEIQDDLHVSGHGSQGDLTMLMGLIKPTYYLPIGGTPRHMRAYAELVSRMNVPQERVFEIPDCQVVEVSQDKVYLGEKIKVADIYVDGSQVGGVGTIVIRDRQELASEGVLVASIPWSRKEGRVKGEIQIVSRGFVYMKESQELIKELVGILGKSLQSVPRNANYSEIRGKAEKELSDYIYKATRRNPVILSAVIEV